MAEIEIPKPAIDLTDKVTVYNLREPEEAPQQLYPAVAKEVCASNSGNWYGLEPAPAPRRGRPPKAAEKEVGKADK